MYGSDSNTITNNTCNYNNNDGIILITINGIDITTYDESSDNNAFLYNHIEKNNGYGINLSLFSGNNYIHHNYFIKNNNGKIQAFDNGNNNDWNTMIEGNYWSDWTTPDDDWNGIVDSPY